MSLDSSVSAVTRYKLNELGSVPFRELNIRLLHRVQSESGANPASCPMTIALLEPVRPQLEGDRSLSNAKVNILCILSFNIFTCTGSEAILSFAT
jgi:hypothetical protein